MIVDDTLRKKIHFINDAASRVSSEQVSDDGIDTSFCDSQTYDEMMADFSANSRESTKTERAKELLQTIMMLLNRAPQEVLVRLIADAFRREQRIALKNA